MTNLYGNHKILESDQFKYPWHWDWSSWGGRLPQRHTKPRAARRMPRDLRRLLEKPIGRKADPDTLPLFGHARDGGWIAYNASHI